MKDFTLTQRLLLFIFGCIGIRLFFVYATIHLLPLYPSSYLYVGIAALLLSASWIYLYFTKSRMNAPEAGGLTWWNDLRPDHATLYLLFGLMALSTFYKYNDYSQVLHYPLLLDVLFGLAMFVNYHHKQGDF